MALPISSGETNPIRYYYYWQQCLANREKGAWPTKGNPPIFTREGQLPRDNIEIYQMPPSSAVDEKEEKRKKVYKLGNWLVSSL